MQAAAEIYRGFAAADILAMNDQQIEALVLNSWIILTSWVRFLCTVRSNPGDLSEELMRRGVYQILALEAMTDYARGGAHGRPGGDAPAAGRCLAPRRHGGSGDQCAAQRGQRAQ